MLRFKPITIFLAGMLSVARLSKDRLIDFTDGSEKLNEWREISDVVRVPGMSKATLVQQQTQLYSRAVFFTLLNPQPNGAGFAGMGRPVQWDLSNNSCLEIRARGQGNNTGYKISLRHRNLNTEPNPAYEYFFTAPTGEFGEVKMPLAEFYPYFRGRKLTPEEAPSLDTSNITFFEIQMYGGVYSPIKQAGASSLEIEWVRAC